MSYIVQVERSAQKQLAKISQPFQSIIKEKLLVLENDPRPPGCKKLKGQDGWRIRVADFRIVYKIFDNVLQIIVIDIDNRKQIYR